MAETKARLPNPIDAPCLANQPDTVLAFRLQLLQQEGMSAPQNRNWRPSRGPQGGPGPERTVGRAAWTQGVSQWEGALSTVATQPPADVRHPGGQDRPHGPGCHTGPRTRLPTGNVLLCVSPLQAGDRPCPRPSGGRRGRHNCVCRPGRRPRQRHRPQCVCVGGGACLSSTCAPSSFHSLGSPPTVPTAVRPELQGSVSASWGAWGGHCWITRTIHRSQAMASDLLRALDGTSRCPGHPPLGRPTKGWRWQVGENLSMLKPQRCWGDAPKKLTIDS